VRVTKTAIYDRKRQGYDVTTRLVLDEAEARERALDDATERAVILGGRAHAKLDEILARRRPEQKPPKRIVVEATSDEIGAEGFAAMLQVLAAARDSHAPNRAAIESARVDMRATLLRAYAAFGAGGIAGV
jgi:hypothetical protein